MQKNYKKKILDSGEIINDTYEVKSFISEGAFGEVYTVEHKYLGKQVLKVLKENISKDIDLKNITQEAKVLSELTDKNIIRVFEANEFTKHGKLFYFVSMEFVPGEPLSKLLNRKNFLRVKQAVDYQVDILKGLKYAHTMKPPVIHRDISPDNVLISYKDEEKRALLSDFGLACTYDKKKKLPNAKGKYMYFAPECFLDVYVPASDVYSAGIIFYKMLTGRQPWNYQFSKEKVEQEEIETIILKARKEDIKPPSRFNDCDEELDKIILKSLSYEIKDRYRDAEEFLEELINYQVRYKDEHKTKKTIKDEKREKKRGFDLVAGMNDLKESLIEDVIKPLNEKELYEEYHVKALNGILLYGPPGCGKTYIARRLAEEVNFYFKEIKPSNIASTFIHGTQEKINELFEECKKNAPSILFIDEIDAVLPKREKMTHHSYASEVNEFLAQMTDCSEDGIFIIGATNIPEKIDDAIIRTGRIDKIFYVPPPDYEARKEMFKLYLSDRPIKEDINFELLAELTENYVSSDIKYIVDEASKLALKSKEKINDIHIRKIILKTKFSVTDKQVHYYERFKDKRNFE